MKTHKITVLALLLTVGWICVPTALAQINITSSSVSTNGVYLVQSAFPGSYFRMNNLLFVRQNTAVLVDTLPPGTYLPFGAVIHSLTSQKPISTLINTHWHFDHVGLNADFRQKDGTETIIAHWREGQYLTGLHCIEDLSSCMPPVPAEGQPTVGVHGEMTLQFPNETLTLKTVENAHSGADLVVYFGQANIVYTGDVYFGGMYPIIDRTGGGTVNGMLHALNQILARIDERTIVVPSHGVLGNRQSVLEFAEMLETCRKQVRALIARGFTEQQVMMDPSFASLDAKWGNGFIPGPVFRMIVYRDLAPSRRGPE